MIRVPPVVPLTLVVVLAPALDARAGTYPTYGCVGRKLQAAAADCTAAFRAAAAWEGTQDDARRDARLAVAAAALAEAFGRADAKVLAQGVDCAETTLSGSAMGALIDAGVRATADAVNTGLDLDRKRDAKCGARLLEAAGLACRKLLAAEARYVRSYGGETPKTARRDRAIAKARAALTRAVEHVTASGCPTAATAETLGSALGAFVGDVVSGTTASPALPVGQWQMITPATEVGYLGQTLRPICSRGTPWVFFARRGTVNKLLIYYQGGGACWDSFTCSVGACSPTADASDNPALTTSGLADSTNPANPFKDWHAVFVTYCTCDVHWGDETFTHTDGGQSITIEHRGAVNAQVAEKYAREHFVVPDEVFVTGSSAGAYGAIANGLYLRERTFRGARFNIVGDAGNGVITPEFQQEFLSRWGIEKNQPRWIPALDRPFTELTLVDVWSEGARFYPHDRFGQYTSAYDGGIGSQTHFYNIMLNPGDFAAGLDWWNASCAWNANMRALAQDAAARVPNYRYYIGAGSRHTIFGSNKVYDDTQGGVIPFVDWIAGMRSDDPAWPNVECAPCNLVAGTCSAAAANPGAACQDDVDCPGGSCQGEDTRPSPLVAPYGPGGVVTCP